MGIVPRIALLGLLCLFVFTVPGRNAIKSATDWGSDRTTEWSTEQVEEDLARQELRERLRGIQPVCGGGFKPHGFEVSEGQAIALALGDRHVSCDRLDVEPMDDGTWAVHVSAEEPNGCEFSTEVDATTGETLQEHRDCP